MKHLILLLILCLSMVSCKKDKTCPEHYSGNNCDVEENPNRVRVTSIHLKNYRITNNGQAWDVNSQWADPYFIISDIFGLNLYESEYQNEIQPSSVAQWTTDIILDPTIGYVITFYDEDGATDAFINAELLPTYIAGKGFPEKNIIDGDDGSQITVSVEYLF